MDEHFEQLQSRRIRSLVGGQRIAVMALADNLVFVTEEASHINVGLHECGRFFDQNDFRANVKKCASIKVLLVKDKKSMKVITNTHWWWMNISIPSIVFVNLYKSRYLRVSGKSSSQESLTVIWSRYKKLEVYHQGGDPSNAVSAKNSWHPTLWVTLTYWQTWTVVRSILHLPEWTLTNWIHAGTGMRVMDFCKLVLLVHLKAAERMGSETNSAWRALSENQYQWLWNIWILWALERMEDLLLRRRIITKRQLVLNLHLMQVLCLQWYNLYETSLLLFEVWKNERRCYTFHVVMPFRNSYHLD